MVNRVTPNPYVNKIGDIYIRSGVIEQEARLSLNSGLGKVNVVVKEEGRDLFVFLDKICIVFVMTLECVCRE